MQIQKEGYLSRALPRMKMNPDKRGKKIYCDCHEEHGHNIDQCQQLNEDIKALIRKGYIRRYLTHQDRDKQKEKEFEQKTEKTLEPRITQVISGGPGNRLEWSACREVFSLESLSKKVRREVVAFAEEEEKDLNPTQTADDAVVISMKIMECESRESWSILAIQLTSSS